MIMHGGLEPIMISAPDNVALAVRVVHIVQTIRRYSCCKYLKKLLLLAAWAGTE
jgi:hypothetical protein